MILRVLTLLVTVVALWPHSLSAQDTPCDPQYFKSLKSRAWLEAQREITQNQNLIFKPDSVFEYTCFDLHLNELADHAKDMFSETLRWGPIDGIHNNGTDEPTSMDSTLEILIGNALRTYIDQNFEKTGVSNNTYELLGGRAQEVQDANRNVIKPLIDYDFLDTIDGRDNPQNSTTQRNEYNCNIMNQVWMAAKCMDFIDNLEHDGFYTFEQYRDYDGDHRFLPHECGHVTGWEAEIKAAYSNDPNDGTPWIESIPVAFYNLLDPSQCIQNIPIFTGLTVMLGGTSKNEAVCLAPGCYFNPTSGRCTSSP